EGVTYLFDANEDVKQLASPEPFVTSAKTIYAGTMVSKAFIQVIPTGYVLLSAEGNVHKWSLPNERDGVHITCATSNGVQLLIATDHGELYLFEAAQGYSNVDLIAKRDARRMNIGGVAITALTLPTLADDSPSPFCAASCGDAAVRVLNLMPGEDCLSIASETGMEGDSPVAGLALQTSGQTLVDIHGKKESAGSQPFVLTCGANNGLTSRYNVDNVTGALSHPRHRVLDAGSPALPSPCDGTPAGLLVLGALRTWLAPSVAAVNTGGGGRGRGSERPYSPLSLPPLSHAVPFSNVAALPGALIGVSPDCLVLFSVNDRTLFTQVATLPLALTPRSVQSLRDNTIAVLEGESGTDIGSALGIQSRAEERVHRALTEDEESYKGTAYDESVVGPAKVDRDTYASCLRIVGVDDALALHTNQVIPFPPSERATAILSMQFSAQRKVTHVIVGTHVHSSIEENEDQPSLATGGALVGGLTTPHDKTLTRGHMHTYAYSKGTLTPVHSTALPLPVNVMCQVQGRLAVGAGAELRIYDIGTTKLLLKCRVPHFPSNVVKLVSHKDQRLWVGDASESYFACRYRVYENIVEVQAGDAQPRWISAGCPLDRDTFAVADKFGSIAVLRIPDSVIEKTKDDSFGLSVRWDTGISGVDKATTKKLDHLKNIASIHLGDTVTSLFPYQFGEGREKMLVYATISGTIGVLCPMTALTDTTMGMTLQTHMEKLQLLHKIQPSIIMRNHRHF
ncbi:hypothetical protein KIPB_009857, partial [Kipferlia bialata]